MAIRDLLRTDPRALDAAERDFGDIVRDRPRYVARPRSTEEVAELVRFARAEHLPVAARGVGHSAGGQSQVAGGLVIVMDDLDALHHVDVAAMTFEADAGLRWRRLMAELVPKGLTPPVVTDWLELSLGGTIAAGGVGAQSFRHGLQADAVEGMRVVTGKGEILECSAEREPELFEASRGGLGQYGIITRVRMRVTRAPRRVCVDHLVFADLSRFIDAVEWLGEQDDTQGLLAHAIPNELADVVRSLGRTSAEIGIERSPVAGRWLYDLELLRHAAANELGPLPELARKLGAIQPFAVRHEHEYSEFVNRVPPIVERDRRVGRAPHPELALFVPGARARLLFAELMDHLQVEDLGGGPVLLIPLRRGRARSPFVRLPDDEHCWLLGLLRAAPRPERVAPMVRDNLELWRRASEVGSLRYPVDGLSEPATRDGWAAHYGAIWPRAQAAKRRYDPDRLLAPRLAVFGGTPG